MAVVERIIAKKGEVGGLPISRALPVVGRRMIGAWCFLDHAGPATLAPGQGMRVGPHPHTGLQTFSWMIEGEILHRDSLGTEQVLRGHQVNLMTAGRGICHSEESLTERLQLAQLWIALPEEQRHCEPEFEHFPMLPRWAEGEFKLTLLTGQYAGHLSPVLVYTPLLGLDIANRRKASAKLPLKPSFEHGLMVLEGRMELSIDGEVHSAEPGELLYIAPGTVALELQADAGSRALLLGGTPFEEPLLLWWNFVGRHPDEIRRFAADWNAGQGFGEVRGYDGERLLAPEVPALRTP